MVDLNTSAGARELTIAMVEQLRDHLLSKRADAEYRAAAEYRAIGLLRSWLTPEQHAQYLCTKGFTCIGSHTGRTYTLTTDAQFNVICDESDDPNGDKHQRYCAILNALPGDLIGDRLLAQKIIIETDEPGFLRIANKQGALYSPNTLANIFHSEPEPTAPGIESEQENVLHARDR